MNIIEIATINKFDDLIEKLEQAIKDQNKQNILHCFDKINLINFDVITEQRLIKYDNLIESSNDILYK